MRKDRFSSFYMLRKDDTRWMDRSEEIHDIKSMDKFHVFYTVQMLKRENEKNKRLNRKLYDIPDLLLQRLDEFMNEYPEFFI